jgi:hypothetical protein
MSALFRNTMGTQNTANGVGALNQNTVGSENTANGYNSLFTNVTGNTNTAIGNLSGFNSLGSGNVFLGYQAGYNETGSNKLYIANNSTGTPLILGDFAAATLGVNVSSVAAGLTLNVGGKVGATQYCDQDGNNCVAGGSLGGGGGTANTGYNTLSWGAGVTTQTIAHGLGRVPKKVTFRFDPQLTGSSGTTGWSVGTWTTTGQSYTAYYDHGTNSWSWSGGTGLVGYIRGSNRAADMVATTDATNITLTIPVHATWGIGVGVQWEAE